jgi:prepilin-type N-terminal cleavage/methylation domain-containing protein
MSATVVFSSRRRFAARGFTLIEVLVAISMLGFGLLSLAGGVTIVSRLVDRGRSSGRVAFVALAQLETLRLVNLASPGLCGGGSSGSLVAEDLAGSWTAARTGASLSVVVEITGWRGRTWAIDTVSTALPC